MQLMILIKCNDHSILKHFMTPNRRDPDRGPQLRERQGCEREPQTRPDERALEVHRELLLQLRPCPPCRRLQLWQDPRVLPACHKCQVWGHRIRRRGQEIYLGAPRQQIGQFSTASSGLCLPQKQPRPDPSESYKHNSRKGISVSVTCYLYNNLSGFGSIPPFTDMTTEDFLQIGLKLALCQERQLC